MKAPVTRALRLGLAAAALLAVGGLAAALAALWC